MTDASPADMRDDALGDFYAALLDDDPVALYERAPCGYLSMTPDGTIIKANQTFLTLTGYERSDLVGRKTFAQLLTAGGRIYHETHYAPLLQMHGTAREIALDIVGKDGKRIPVLVNTILERDGDGNPIVARAAVFDATERREYERELVRAKERAEASQERATVLARTLQQTLIPPTPPSIPGLDIAAAYRPAGSGEEVGGDFYDIFEIGAGDWAVVVGDVCGKGVDAAAITALARHTIRAAAVHQRRPSAILGTLNEVLLRHDTDRFCTVALVRLLDSGSAWTAAVSRGGHPPPLLCREGERTMAAGTPGSLIGVLPEPDLHDEEFVLQPGDRLVLYTDGVTEGRGVDGFFGDERLEVAVTGAGPPARATVDALLREVLAFQDDNPRDDIAIVAIAVP